MSLERLCLACGLCCDGTLFTHVALTDEESRRLGFDGVLRQPCENLKADCRCAVYAMRPKGCARFVCMLGRALEDKEVPFEEAVELVNEARRLREHIDALIPGELPAIPRARRYEAHGTDSELAVKVREARRALEAFTLRHFLGRR